MRSDLGAAARKGAEHPGRSVHSLILDSSRDLWYTGGGAFQPWTFGYQGRTVNGHKGLATMYDVGADYNVNAGLTLGGYIGHASGGRSCNPFTRRGTTETSGMWSLRIGFRRGSAGGRPGLRTVGEVSPRPLFSRSVACRPPFERTRANYHGSDLRVQWATVCHADDQASRGTRQKTKNAPRSRRNLARDLSRGSISTSGGSRRRWNNGNRSAAKPK